MPPAPALPTAESSIAVEAVVAVARQHATAVDTDARFPQEAITAARQAGLLGALIPTASGGLGQSLRQVAATCYTLARACSSTAMILAMHHSQAACLVRHRGDTLWHRRFIDRVGREGLLLASVTSESGVGGNVRTSVCAVESTAPGRFRLMKQAPSISYGSHADALLITARSAPGAQASDQVLVVVPAAPDVLSRIGGWNPMGMRGTCTESFMVSASGSADQVLPAPFTQIASETMLPVSHMLWASVWCGIASDAVLRARQCLRRKMRGANGAIPDGASRLVEATERLQAAEARVRESIALYDGRGFGGSFAEAAGLNMLKTSVADMCLAVVGDALLICGFAGYSNEGPHSVSRHLRDLHSARLMIHNDRIRDNTARLLLMQPPLLGVA